MPALHHHPPPAPGIKLGLFTVVPALYWTGSRQGTRQHAGIVNELPSNSFPSGGPSLSQADGRQSQRVRRRRDSSGSPLCHRSCSCSQAASASRRVRGTRPPHASASERAPGWDPLVAAARNCAGACGKGEAGAFQWGFFFFQIFTSLRDL